MGMPQPQIKVCRNDTDCVKGRGKEKDVMCSLCGRTISSAWLMVAAWGWLKSPFLRKSDFVLLLECCV